MSSGGVDGAARLERAAGGAGDPALGEVEIGLEAPPVHARGEAARAEGEAGRARVLHLRAGAGLQRAALRRRLGAHRQRAAEGEALGEAGDLSEGERAGLQLARVPCRTASTRRGRAGAPRGRAR